MRLTTDQVADCKADLLKFTRTMFRARKGADMRDNKHQEIICSALERVVIGKTKRLIINVPPRSGKTEMAVINFMAWATGVSPSSEWIHASYSKRIATNNAYQVRELIRHEAYKKIFPGITIKEDSSAKDEFRTEQGGIIYATGADGSITGRGAGGMQAGFFGAIVIDDPHKAGEASSDTMRQNVIDWFSTTMESRKNSPDTPIILIMQRLHENDLSGYLLRGGNGETWEHLNIPAITDDGESFWPVQFPLSDLRRLEAADSYRFAGQYMQQPAPTAGGVIKPDMIQVVDAIPANVAEWCRGWDLASTLGGDFTAGVKVARLHDGRYLIADVVRDRLESHQRDAMIKATAMRDGKQIKQSIPQDPGQAGKSQVLAFAQLLAGHNAHFSPETGDKVTRATPLASQINAGNVIMLRAPWNQPFMDEGRMFPNGSFDDQIDAASRAFNGLLRPSSGLFT
jgi:predicted phage terminase large subunit-like protein